MKRVLEFFEKSNLAQRVLVAAVYFPLFLVSAFDSTWFALYLTILLPLLWYEFLKLSSDSKTRLAPHSIQFFSLIALGSLPAIFSLSNAPIGVAFIVALLFVQLSVIVGMKNKKTLNEILSSLAVPVTGYFYLTIPISFLLLIQRMPHKAEAGVWFLAFVIAGSDTIAYFVGRKLGRRPFFQHISPKKTMEGFWGGLLGAVLTSVALYYGLSYCNYSVPSLPVTIALALLIALAGVFGDLFESLLKRTAGVKDSGTIMGGHGGVLDRFDSLLFGVIPLFFYMVIMGGFK